MAPRKRKFETIQQVEAAYATPDEYESRDEARKRKQRRRQAIARFRKSSNQNTATLGDSATSDTAAATTTTTASTPAPVGFPVVTPTLASVLAPAAPPVSPIEVMQSTTIALAENISSDSIATSTTTNPSTTAGAMYQAQRRATMTSSQRNEVRIRDRERHRQRRAQLTDSQREAVRERNRSRQTTRRSMLRSRGLDNRERETNSTTRAQQRSEMTEDQRFMHRERERLRRHSKQYGKAFAFHEDFDPAVVEGRDTVNGRHYVPRAKKPNCSEDNVCPYCGAWKFKTESKGSCCMAGAVRLPQRRGSPMPLARLFNDAEFLRMARVYNNVFAFTSMGATPSKKLEFDDSVAGSRGVYTFRVMGSLCHRLGSLLPPPDKPPMFAQIYMNDPDIATRVGHRSRMTDGLDPAILTELEIMMQEHNPYAQQFLNAREIVLQRQREARERAQAARQLRREQEGKQEEDMHPPPVEPEEDMVLRLHVREGDNPGTHNQPTASEVAAVIIDANAAEPRDIVLYTRQEGFRRIYETSEHYDPLQYPLLHPYGERGWSYTVKYADGRVRHNKTTMSLREFVAYLLYDRDGQNSTILLGGRLSQQYCVDQWAKVEQERLRFIERDQTKYRMETIAGINDVYRQEGIRDHVRALRVDPAQPVTTATSTSGGNELSSSNVGRRMILPASFTGGPRYMYQRYLDAMAIVREYGTPDLFITMTCNPNWKEIKENILPHQTAQDRPEMVARVWREKMNALLKDLDEGALGIQVARIHVVEFQKRGLPHAHILLVLRPEDKPTSPEKVDRLVSAELPDPEKCPQLYETVVSCMMHGPCGEADPECSCMKNNKCSKKFPKAFAAETVVEQDKFPVYKRRQRPEGRLKHGRKEWDNASANQWVVPYNPYLCQKYDCHINVEVCSSKKAVKYVYKYVYKGSDKATITIEVFSEERPTNEILQYLMARYISPIEACIRLFGHPVQDSSHHVVKLAVHLPNQSMVAWREGTNMRELLSLGERTTLTAYFKICAEEPSVAGVMLYTDIPKKYRWDKDNKRWVRFKKYSPSIGRMIHASPRDGDRFYLRLMLCHKRGATSFEDLRTVDGVVHSSFKDAAKAAGYLEDDSEWEYCLEEGVQFKMPRQLRQLFATIIVYSHPTHIDRLWGKFAKHLSEDFQRKFDLAPDHARVLYNTLKSLDGYLRANGKSLEDYSNDLPQLEQFEEELRRDRLMTLVEREENAYTPELLSEITSKRDLLNEGQSAIFERVVAAVESQESGGKMFFVDGPGGTGKSFLFEQIMAKLRQDGKIVLAVASSGIAATLLTGGKTAHSTFKIPLKVQDKDMCGISKHTQLAELIRAASLIIWDEAPMMAKQCFEAVDRTFQDIMDNNHIFGGKVILFGGDFRQILPVVRGGNIAATVEACLKCSYLWHDIEQLHLTENMRVKTAPNPASALELAEFSEFLLDIGEGRYPVITSIGEDCVRLPKDMCLSTPAPPLRPVEEDNDLPNFNLLRIDSDEQAMETSDDYEDDDTKEERWINALVDAVYPNVESIESTDGYFADRAILAPTNREIHKINDIVAARLPGETREYLSTDTVQGEEQSMFETEYLNSLNFSGIPPHRIVLKVGAPIIMIRNLNSNEGLCNGTRLRIVALKNHCIDASIMVGPRKGQRVLIPRIIFTSDDDDKDFPFHLQRKQFPVVPAFALTINKAQGQSIHNMGLYLRSPVFAHGQLYVALSRVTSRAAIKILIPKDEDIANDDSEQGTLTKNVVYRQIF